jgi:hypothetical protein
MHSLKAIARFWFRSRLTLEETLSVLLAYDKFLELPVATVRLSLKLKPDVCARHAQMYRKLLEEQALGILRLPNLSKNWELKL